MGFQDQMVVEDTLLVVPVVVLTAIMDQVAVVALVVVLEDVVMEVLMLLLVVTIPEVVVVEILMEKLHGQVEQVLLSSPFQLHNKDHFINCP